MTRTQTIRGRNGAVLIYSMTVMVVMLALATIAVDWGHKQLAMTELAGATDAASRAGAGGLANSPSAAIDAARFTGGLNRVDGTNLDVQNADVELGTWDTSTKKFTKLVGTDQFSANACRVLGRRNAARASAVPFAFSSVFGIRSADILCESIAMQVGGLNVDQPVPATANPFLSGMPAGSTASKNNPHDSPDYAGTPSDPKQSPLVVNIALSKGMVLNFDSITGIARHDPSMTDFQPDGELTDIGHNNTTPDHSANYGSTYYNENGLADVRAPINALVGVFLTDKAPNKDGVKTPANLDFSSDASRDFQTLEPKLKQIFFIGDGQDSKGKKQSFVVPEGATRLFLATWDFYEWNNNSGVRTIKVNRPQQIMIVKNELVK